MQIKLLIHLTTFFHSGAAGGGALGGPAGMFGNVLRVHKCTNLFVCLLGAGLGAGIGAAATGGGIAETFGAAAGGGLGNAAAGIGGGTMTA